MTISGELVGCEYGGVRSCGGSEWLARRVNMMLLLVVWFYARYCLLDK